MKPLPRVITQRLRNTVVLRKILIRRTQSNNYLPVSYQESTICLSEPSQVQQSQPGSIQAQESSQQGYDSTINELRELRLRVQEENEKDLQFILFLEACISQI